MPRLRLNFPTKELSNVNASTGAKHPEEDKKRSEKNLSSESASTGVKHLDAEDKRSGEEKRRSEKPSVPHVKSKLQPPKQG